MKNKKSAGFKMKKSAAKMFGMAALAGQRMMNPNYTPPTQTDQGPMGSMMGAFDPSQLSEAQKKLMQTYNKQMRAYKRNEFLGQQKGIRRRGYKANMEMPVKPNLDFGRPNPYATLTPEQIRKMSINERSNPSAGIMGSGPRRFNPFTPGANFSGGASQVGNMVAQLAPFTMKRGNKPNKSEFFKGKK